MVNRAAKRRKDEKRDKDRDLDKYGRTPAQIRRNRIRRERKKRDIFRSGH